MDYPCLTFVYVNVNMCKLGLHPVSAPYYFALGMAGLRVWEVLQKVWCFTATVSGGVGMFVPMIMVVEWYDTGAVGLFQMLVSCS